MTKTSIANSETSDTLTSSAIPALAPGEVILGQFVGIDAAGNPLVSYPQLTESAPFVAMSTVPIVHQYIGRQVALLFARGDYHQPVIIGFIHSPLHDLLESFSMAQSSEGTSDNEIFESSEDVIKDHAPDDDTKTIRVDGKKVILEGQEEVVLTCGEASITLTKAGKILIRGKYLLSRSSGVNRILGGSVQVN